MELLQLNENEIKIVLSKQDLKELDLTLRTIDYNTTKTRKAIWEIFDRARDQTGFDAAKNRIYVKMYPLPDGGCEMYVSKLVGKNDVSFCRKDRQHKAGRQGIKAVVSKRAFLFDDFEALYSACRAITTRARSSLYLSPEGEYILLLKDKRRTVPDAWRWSEFGRQIKSKYITAHLDERCRCLCSEGAVERIAGKERENDKSGETG